MKHIGIFNTSGNVQTAIANEALLNPYVAKVSGALDYNSVVPTPPAPATMGTWTHDAQYGEYLLLITDDTPEYWANPVYIGKMNDVYVEGGGPIDLDIYINMEVGESSSSWHMELTAPTGVSETPMYDFPEEGGDWCTGIYTDPENPLESEVCADWNYTPNSFHFAGYPGGEHAVSITTHDPEYPEASE